jgi:DNA-directed RNA polymerase subunit RPC12/RpoP
MGGCVNDFFERVQAQNAAESELNDDAAREGGIILQKQKEAAKMANNSYVGDSGESYLTKRIACPNCGKGLMKLPRGFPLFDVQCKNCFFRAQIKTSRTKDSNRIYGAGWEILNKTLKSGYAVPPLIVIHRFGKRNTPPKIRFYPFIPRRNLEKYELKNIVGSTRWRFIYKDLTQLPHFVWTGNEWTPGHEDDESS